MTALPATLGPYPYNYVYNVNFYKSANMIYNEVLGDFGRFKTTIHRLKIREGSYLLVSGKKDIRGLTFQEYEQHLPAANGSLVQWVVISEAHDLNIVFNRDLAVRHINFDLEHPVALSIPIKWP